MKNHTNSFFIKEGPREVEFDIDKVFLHNSGNGQVISLRSEEIKDLLDEKLLKLDYSLKQRHVELVDYLRKVEGRISRVEDEILGHGVNSLEEIGNFGSKSMNLLGIKSQTNVRDDESGDSIRKEVANLPNISLDQEELDALLEGLNEISRDNKKSLSSSNNLVNDVGNRSFEKVSGNESSGVDINHDLSATSESNTYDIPGLLPSKGDEAPLGVNFATSECNNPLIEPSSLSVVNNVGNCDSSKAQELMTSLYDDKFLRASNIDENSAVNSDSGGPNDINLDNLVLNEGISNSKSIDSKMFYLMNKII